MKAVDAPDIADRSSEATACGRQHLRHHLPLHHLGRKPRAGHRLRRRRRARRASRLTEADIQPWLDKRRPGQSRFTTQRQEPRQGADPLRRVRGPDHRHADLAADRERRRALQGLRRHRATSSAPATPTTPIGPNTASATIAAAAAPRRARPRRASPPAPSRARSWAPASRSAARWSRSARTRSTARAGTGTEIERQPVLLPRRRRRRSLGRLSSTSVRKAGSSAGAVIEVVAEGVPAGLGAPIYGKLDADLAAAMMSINAVKGVEIGAGFAAAALSRRGERRRDAHGRTARSRSCPTTPAASWAASPPASRSSRASPSSRPARS